MAAQEYYNPQAYAARQHALYGQSQYSQSHQGLHQQLPSSQQPPYNLSDYKPALPQNDSHHTSQPPPPYSLLPSQQFQSTASPPPHPAGPQHLQPHDPRQGRPQHLALPQHPPYPSQHNQNGHLAIPSRATSEPPGARTHRHNRHGSGHRPRRRSRSRSRSRSGGRDLKKDHTGRNTFLGAGGGALVGDLIFPGLGTVGGAILGGLGGHGASNRKSRSTDRKERS